MCGISGIIYKEGKAEPSLIARMNDTLVHRGPDAGALFTEGKAALGHRRLSVIDLSESAGQPMHSQCGRYVMVYNGELYNYRELARELGLSLRGSSDSEVLLESFALRGPSVISSFNGMFAAAIWDRREEQLFLFRDRMGIKPLFLAQNSERIVFASELKALLPALPPPEINPAALSAYLHLGYIPAPDTVYRGISKFPPATRAVWKDGEWHTEPYWRMEEALEAPLISDLSSAKREYAKLLEDAVRKRLVSDVPLGTFLSGGIDSSLVTAVAQKYAGEPIRSFSIAFDDPRHDESQYAAAIAARLGTRHRVFRVSSRDAMERIPRVLELFDEPFADSSFIPTMMVSELAHRDVTVALSGDGGDELFHGYGMYRWAERLDHPLMRAGRKPLAAVLRRLPDRYRRVAALLDYERGESLTTHLFSQEQYFFSRQELKHLAPALAPPAALPLALPPGRRLTPAEKQALFDLHYYLPDDLLTKVDRSGMAHSLELRVPLLDHRLVEFALRLAPSLKIRKGVLKYFLKETLADYLPRPLFERPKRGFSVPLRYWLSGDLRSLPEEYLSKEAIARTGFLEWKDVARLKKRYYAGDSYLFNRIWALIVLQKFLMEKMNPGKS